MFPLASWVFRLTMWLPCFVCRSLRAHVGQPRAWFLPGEWV